MTDRLKIGQEVLIHGYIDEIRKDTVIIRNEGGYFGTVECEVTDIEMPDTDEKKNRRDEDIKIGNSDKYATVKQATARYKICRNTLMKYADQFHALARFGRSVRVDIEKLDAAFAGKERK